MLIQFPHRRIHQCTTFNEKSTCFTPWWILLVLITSTPSTTNPFTFSSVNPPLTSIKNSLFSSNTAFPSPSTPAGPPPNRPLSLWTALPSSSPGAKLSSITTSAPALMASTASASLWHSTSTLMEKPPAALAARTARADSATAAARLSDARYRAGVDSFLNTLDSQRT
ncbi:MAG: hypothetical protein Q9177_006360, partial [Variospora cf. flavescens]